MINKYLIAISCLLSSQICFGSIFGLIIDKNQNQALAYASIAVQGKSIGSISNSEGYFQLDTKGISETDTLLFSYLGYQTVKIPFNKFRNGQKVYLEATGINLKEVTIYSNGLDPREVMEKVKLNFRQNHPLPPQKQRIFLHAFTRTPFPDQNKIEMTKSDFESFDVDTYNEIYNSFPDEFIDYNDGIFDLYSLEGKHKIKAVQAISLQEGSQGELLNMVDRKLEGFIDDFYETVKNDDTYYKIKTSIIGTKIGEDPSDDYDPAESKSDSAYYILSAGSVRYQLLTLLKNYTRADGDNLDFIEKPHKYRFFFQGVSYFNDEPVLKISFSPKRGLFQGNIYVSTQSYAVLQIEMEYAPGKSSENFQLFGIGHSIPFKKAKVIYEKSGDAYFIKYLSIEEKENASLDRRFTLMKKQKRRFFDKTLNTMKIDVDIAVQVKSQYEVLVLNREAIEKNTFDELKQDRYIKFRKEYSNSAEIWNDKTIIVPTQELKAYTRKAD